MDGVLASEVRKSAAWNLGASLAITSLLKLAARLLLSVISSAKLECQVLATLHTS